MVLLMKKDKARDIARGALASTARRSVREDKRNFHATHRHVQHQINHEIVRSTTVVDDDGHLYTDPDLFDDFEPRHVIDGYAAKTKKDGAPYDCDLSYIVNDRRNSDNLGALMSWARGTERQKMVGWSAKDKYAYFKSVLPDNLPGRHALDHVESALDLRPNEFHFGGRYRRPPPVTKERFLGVLNNLLSTSKGRVALHEFILETVPVAGHHTEVKNKVRSSETARDENGKIRYLDIHRWDSTLKRMVINTTRSPMKVDVYIPQIVSTTCPDCSFLRNDPLATTAAINHFVDLVWAHRYSIWYPRCRLVAMGNDHSSFHTVRQHIIDSREIQ